jgi:HEAT repeat protein
VLPYLKDVFSRLTDYRDIARAFQAAASYGTDEALKWIAQRFTSAERGDVKKAALRALADIGGDLAEDILFDLLENAEDYTDRRRVVGVFLENPNPENIKRIKEMLEKEPPPSVAARILLAGLLGLLYREGADGDETDFNAFSEREVPFLTDIVNSKRTGALRRDALQSLINIWTDDAQAIVSQVLSDNEQRVELRILAGKALASHGQISALGQLQKMLDSINPRAKVGAAEAILILKAETGDPNVEAVLDEKVIPVLKAMLLRRETAYVRNAATALAAIGSTKARDALIEIINTSPVNPARIQTIRALGAFADKETAAALEDLIGKEGSSDAVRKAASETLARIRNELKRKNP